MDASAWPVCCSCGYLRRGLGGIDCKEVAFSMGEVFSGVRIVELAQFVFVPAAGAMLADHGAEVIHIERVGSGDPYRTLKVADGRVTKSANLSMEQNNRGKKSVALDLKSEAGRDVFFRLIE